jgi:hypothetical protein
MNMLPVLWSLWLAPGCSSSPAEDKEGDSQAETGEQTDTESQDRETGCVRGLLKDYNNAALPYGNLRAFTHPPCTQRAEATAEADGSFCIDGIPVDTFFELQAEFKDRCSWWHAQEVGPISRGGCNDPVLTCLEIGVWFECTPEGGTPSCE